MTMQNPVVLKKYLRESTNDSFLFMNSWIPTRSN